MALLPTPDTSHVPYSRVYEPAEDSFLLLDTLSSASETAFLTSRFARPLQPPSPSPSTPSPQQPPSATPPPFILEVGTGSGVVLAFLTAHARTIFGTSHVLTAGVDVNRFACAATAATVNKAVAAAASSSDRSGSGEAEAGSGSGSGAGSGLFLAALLGDLTSPLRPGQIDVLVFNPPYVPTPEMPSLPVWDSPSSPPSSAAAPQSQSQAQPQPLPSTSRSRSDSHAESSRLLELSYAGGKDGMETTDRLVERLPGLLSERGVAYLLLCAQNRPDEFKERVRREFGEGWMAETVGTSGKVAGWERLVIVRIWREGEEGLERGLRREV